VNNEQNIQHSAGDDLRARIVAAARDCFNHFGFGKTSMQEIAAACDMSAANLYRFYDGKLAIGAAVAAYEQSVLLAACDQAVSTASPDVAERLIALFQTSIDATRRKMKRTPLLFELDLTVTREKQELRRQFLHEIEVRIIAIFSNSHDASTFESVAIKLRSKMILMACATFVLPWMLLNEPFGNPRSMVEPLIRSLIAGLSDGPLASIAPTSARGS
jgi:AcrR family transcriptional regulator